MADAQTTPGFTALKLEGGILPVEFLRTVAALRAPRQTGSDYGLSRSLAIREEIARYWRIANDLRDRYAQRRPRNDLDVQQVGIEDWLVPLLRSTLGYADLIATSAAMCADRAFRLTHHACGGAVPLLLVTENFALDKADPQFGHEGRRQAPHTMMQEYLNGSDTALWGIVSNGSRLRLLRDNTSLTRPAYLEVDLELLFEEELYPDFSALWLALHSSRLQPQSDKPSNCIIESWRKKAHETGERVRENLRSGVTLALEQIGNGFLQYVKNTRLHKALESGTLTPERYFQQLLRLVYRLLFLFTVEERNLLHAPDATGEQRKLFTQGYSLARLRERALRLRHYDHNRDLWQGLLITFRALARGAPGLGLPALGGLFRADQCPDLDEAAITNQCLLEAIRNLAFFRSDNSLARVNYRDMGAEELGSVYESLLELQPVIDISTSTFSMFGEGNGEKTRGSERKLTGSYYTPPTLVSELVASTLDLVIERAIASRPNDPRAAILELNVIDPACGSGHFLLAAARRLAAEIARIESGDDTMDETGRQHALRQVVQHCIHGVDRNPLAVELCKAALWMEAIEPGKPLTFLDAHILQGDSLVGILDPQIMANGIPDSACKPLKGDDKAVCQTLKKRNRQSGQRDFIDQDAALEVAVTSIDLDEMPEDTIQEVDRKRTAYTTTREENINRAREMLRANLFTSAYFTPKTPETLETVPQNQDIYRLDHAQPQRRGVKEQASALQDKHSFLHWHLAFAEIMQDGGFDVVLGNPPWERIKLQEQEFFASRSPQIADAPNKATRDRLIQKLNSDSASPREKALFREFAAAKREAEATGQFARTGGRFPLAGIGDLNTYAIFAELFLQLINPHGRAGMIVPTGIATDDSTKTFFNHIVNERRLVSLFDFENRQKVFPGIDSRTKFCLLTLSGKNAPVPETEFTFFLHRTEQLKEAKRCFTLGAEDFALFNPNTRTCPVFRTRRDLEIARKMYQRAGILWREAKGSQPQDNPWGVKFSTMFHMSNDSGLFRTRTQMEEDGWQLDGHIFVQGDERYLPLYEAKLFHQYDHRFATFDGVSVKDIRNGKPRSMTADEKSDPETVAIPRYWIAEKYVAEKLDKSEIMSSHLSNRTEQNRTEQNRTEQNRTEQNRTEQNRTEQNRTEQNRTEQNRTEQYSILSPSWLADRFPKNYELDQRTNGDIRHDSGCRIERFRNNNQNWIIVFRDISNATNQRTAILTVIRSTAVSNKAPLLNIDGRWVQAFRGITNSTNERTLLADNLPQSGVGNSAPVVDYKYARTIASTLILANMNSLPLDWAARFSVGGTNMNFFIVKQLPVLPPEEYLKESVAGLQYVELIAPRVLQLTYTSQDMAGFAMDLGFKGPPFAWDEEQRHQLRCELDAIFAHMYGLDRPDLEWILDAPPPGSSFPSLKENEVKKFGEYRTQRLVLQAFDQLARGEAPTLALPDELHG